MLRGLLERILCGEDLSQVEAGDLLERLTDPDVPRAVSGALLAALRSKGETADEIRGFALAMQRLAVRPQLEDDRAVDVVGTGGDGSGSLNLSTGSALLAAACGQPVIKHGNRSVSSRCGSADVLEALGLELSDGPGEAARCFRETGFTFLFAPAFHPAMRALAPVRGVLGVRTVFNVLGPLANPARPPFAVIGAFCPEAARLMAQALAGMPVKRAFVVHGAPGWDEATPVGPFLMYDVRGGTLRRHERDPLDVGLARCSPSELLGGASEENARSLEQVFDGVAGPHCDALVLGAALALEVAGEVDSLAEGTEKARAAIDDGSARERLDLLRAHAGSRRRAAGGGRG